MQGARVLSLVGALDPTYRSFPGSASGKEPVSGVAQSWTRLKRLSSSSMDTLDLGESVSDSSIK